MAEQMTGFTKALQDLGDERARALAGHPDPSYLVVYSRGELSDAEERELQDHLALCSECTDLVLDLPLFHDEEVEALEEGVVDRQWADLQSRLDSSSERRARQAPIVARRVWKRRFSIASVAAGVATAAFAVAFFWGLSEHDQIRAAREPRANVPIHELQDPTARRDVAMELVQVELSRETPEAVLALSPPFLPEAETFFATIVDSNGTELWRAENLKPDELDTFTVVLSRGFLAPGRYQATVYGQAGGVRNMVGRFPFEVVTP